MRKTILLFAQLTLMASFSYAQTVTIGTQVWSIKNLDVSTFRNGDSIPEAKSSKEWKIAAKNGQPAWCYYKNNSVLGSEYGKLYNWYAVHDPRGLAPEGWHIPSDEEWTTLADHLGGAGVAGEKMKSEDGWRKNGNGSNESGFSGIPAGLRTASGSFQDVGKVSITWSTTPHHEVKALVRFLVGYGKGYDSVLPIGFDKGYGLSVRCLKD